MKAEKNPKKHFAKTPCGQFSPQTRNKIFKIGSSFVFTSDGGVVIGYRQGIFFKTEDSVVFFLTFRIGRCARPTAVAPKIFDDKPALDAHRTLQASLICLGMRLGAKMTAS